MDLKKYLDSLAPTTMVDPKLAKVINQLTLFYCSLLSCVFRVTCIRSYKEQCFVIQDEFYIETLSHKTC